MFGIQDVVITIPREVLVGLIGFAIGAASTLIALIAAELRIVK